MNRYGIACIIALCLTACSSCSSNNPGSDGGGGACTNVAICTLITQAQVSSSLGVMATVTTPSTTSGSTTSDDCAYGNPSPAANTNVSLSRTCYADGAVVAAVYDQAYKDYLAPMGTRTDLAGVGDKAFYQAEPHATAPNVTKVKLVALKGQLFVILKDAYVPAAQDATVKQGLTSFANTLLK